MTAWVQQLRAGSEHAARKLWEHYFPEMVRTAERRLATSFGAFDAEDVALSAFNVFCRAIKEGRYERLSRGTGLWSLLAVTTLRKASDRIKVEGAARRGGGRKGPRLTQQQGVNLDSVPASLSDPQFLAIMAEECRRLLNLLDDDELERVALWRMDGYTDSEIAARLGYSRRTIQRMVTVIRTRWMREAEDVVQRTTL